MINCSMLSCLTEREDKKTVSQITDKMFGTLVASCSGQEYMPNYMFTAKHDIKPLWRNN